MSFLDISEWKAFLLNPTVCRILMNDVTMKEIDLNYKHNGKLNFYLYRHSGTILICVSMALLAFLLRLNSLQSDFVVHFSRQLSAYFVVN